MTQNSIKDSHKRAKFEKLQSEISIKKRFDAVRSEILKIKKQLPYNLAENIESEMMEFSPL